MSGVERKNCWQLAEEAGHARPGAMQRLLRSARWDADGERDEVRSYVLDHLGGDGVSMVDETGFLKKGLRSAGVQRHYTGSDGRIENAQVVVFLACASSRGQALIGRRLYLPEHPWCQDPDRRSGSGIPEKVEFATKPRLAWQMIEAALDAGCSSNWVTGDEVYGQDPQLRSALEAHGYVLAVACTTKVRINENRTVVQAATVAASLPRDTWHRQSTGAGAKGPYDWTWVQTGADKNRFLLIRRNPATGEPALYRCWSPGQAALATPIRVAGTRWCIEECFQAAEGQVGLDHHQVRHWTSWHRHITLVMLAPGLPHRRCRQREARPEHRPEPPNPQLRPDRPVHPGDPPPHRHALQTTGHTAAPPSGLVYLAQAPPGAGQTRPLPTMAHQPLGHLDREVTLEY